MKHYFEGIASVPLLLAGVAGGGGGALAALAVGWLMPPSLAMCAFIQPSQHKFYPLSVSYFYQTCVRPIQHTVVVATQRHNCHHHRFSPPTLTDSHCNFFVSLCFVSIHCPWCQWVSCKAPVCAPLPLPCRAHRNHAPANKPELDKLAKLPQCDTFTRDTLLASFIPALGQLSINDN